MLSSNSDITHCQSCGASLPDIDSSVHSYLDASPGCWAIYGEVLARKYSDYRYMSVHQYTADSYAVQHPGQPSPQTQQSVAVHLASLYLIFERGMKVGSTTPFMQRRTARKSELFWLNPPTDLGMITIRDLWESGSVGKRIKTAREWAECAWTA